METKEREEHLEQGPWRGRVEVFVSDHWKVPAPLCPEDEKMHGCQLQMLGAQPGGVGGRMWCELSLQQGQWLLGAREKWKVVG